MGTCACMGGWLGAWCMIANGVALISPSLSPVPRVEI